MLAICRPFVNKITYESHFRRLSNESDEEVLQSFFQTLAGLRSESQDECFQKLITELIGYGHVTDRLKEGKVPMFP